VASGFFLSTAGIALRLVEQADGWQILFYRSLALSVTILLILVFQKRSRFFDEFRGLGWNDCLLAVFLGTGFVAYVFALLYNTVANALFIFSCAPFVAGFLGWILLGERVATRTWFAIGVAMAGLAVMVGSELAVSHYLGTLLALWIPIAYAASIIAVRRSKRDNMLVALCLAGLVAGGLSAFFVTDYALTLALVEPVLAPIWAWMGVGEVPGLATIVGGTIIFLAIATDGILNIKSSESNSA
jgi:drug/metabolite transporter (DMT)-like permease